MDPVAPEDLVALSQQLRDGELTPQECVGNALDRVNALDDRVRALLPEDAFRDRLYAAVDRLAERYAGAPTPPPLYGIPVGVKDLFRVDGLPTQAGSRLPPELFAGAEAESVTRLKRAGALVLGKTVTTEFAYFSPGPTSNPWNSEHTPGGSSSGSAAAVAAGYTPLALGTQTIGSVSRPASFCGIVGFKPSSGRIPTDGVIPFSPTVDHVGVFVNSVASASLAAQVLCNDWSRRAAGEGGDEHGQAGGREHGQAGGREHGRAGGREHGRAGGHARPVIGVLEDAYVAQAEDYAREAVSEVVRRLSEAGYHVRTMALFDDIETINGLHNDLIAHEFAEVHRQWYAQYGQLYSQKSRELVEKGKAVSAERARTARSSIASTRDRVQATMDERGVSLVISPSTVGEAPRGLGATGSPIMNLPWTFCGLPTITLPAGAGPSGLPLGVQVAGRFDADEELLASAAGIERAIAAMRPAR